MEKAEQYKPKIDLRNATNDKFLKVIRYMPPSTATEMASFLGVCVSELYRFLHAPDCLAKSTARCKRVNGETLYSHYKIEI